MVASPTESWCKYRPPNSYFSTLSVTAAWFFLYNFTNSNLSIDKR